MPESTWHGPGDTVGPVIGRYRATVADGAGEGRRSGVGGAADDGGRRQLASDAMRADKPVAGAPFIQFIGRRKSSKNTIGSKHFSPPAGFAKYTAGRK